MDPADLPPEWWTPLGVRLRRVRQAPGACNWLFFPGLAGADSQCLTELVGTVRAPGTSWLVDLPGSGSNGRPPGAPADPYRLWPDVLLEAVDALPNTFAIGHSIGGQHLLSVPDIEGRVKGLVLISSAPDAGWIPAFTAVRAAHPLPDAEHAGERYEIHPSDENLRQCVVACASWYFTDSSVAAGRKLLGRVAYSHLAADWSEQHFEPVYVSRWWPSETPTLVLSGREDRRIDQTLWNDPYYRAANVTHVDIAGAAHFPWLDQPATVYAAFTKWSAAVVAR